MPPAIIASLLATPELRIIIWPYQTDEVARLILASDFKFEGRRQVTTYGPNGEKSFGLEPEYDQHAELVLWAQAMKRSLPFDEWYHFTGGATEKNHWSEAEWLIEVDEDDPRHPNHRHGRKVKEK